MKKIIGIVVICICLQFNLLGQDFSKEIDEIYNFIPYKLSKSEQKAIFPKLDKLFEKISADTSKYLPLLRTELRSDKHNPYFYFDCGHLLMEISPNKNDQELTVESFSKSDLQDLDRKIYISLVNKLARNNIDVTKAAIKIFGDNKFSFFLPEHSFNFSQDYCLMYCLLPLKADIYTDKLIEVFRQTKEVNTQKSIITTLWFSSTCKGDGFLKSLNKKNTLSKEVANYAKKMLDNKQVDKDYREMFESMPDERINEFIRSNLKQFSDEAIIDLGNLTKIKRQRLNCK